MEFADDDAALGNTSKSTHGSAASWRPRVRRLARAEAVFDGRGKRDAGRTPSSTVAAPRRTLYWRPPVARAAAVLAGLAALLIICAALFVRGQLPRDEGQARDVKPRVEPPPAQAAGALSPTVEAVSGVVWLVDGSGRTPARVGQAVRPEQTVRTEGGGSSASLTFADQTRLQLGAFTGVGFTDRSRTGAGRAGDAGSGGAGRRVLVESGTVVADVSPPPAGAAPMRVITPHAEVVVVGTVFNVTCAPQATHVSLDRGSVRVTRKSGGDTLDVRQGQCVIAGPANVPFGVVPAPRVLREPLFAVRDLLVGAAAVAPAGDRLAVADVNGTVRVLDELGTAVADLGPASQEATALAWSTDGSRLVVATRGRKVTAFDAKTWRALPWVGHVGSNVWSLAYSSDGTRLLAAGGDDPLHLDEVKVRDAGAGEPAADWNPPAGTRGVALSTDGRVIAAGTADGEVVGWDVATRQERFRLRAQPRGSEVSCVAFSPDGALLAAGGADVNIRLWSLSATGVPRERLTLRGHPREVRSLLFFADGQRLASGAHDDTVRVWDTATGRELAVLIGHRSTVLDLSASLDGRRLATGARERLSQLWDLSQIAVSRPVRTTVSNATRLPRIQRDGRTMGFHRSAPSDVASAAGAAYDARERYPASPGLTQR